MNTPYVWEDLEEMRKICDFAQSIECTVDYVMSEFVLDDQFIKVEPIVPVGEWIDRMD